MIQSLSDPSTTSGKQYWKSLDDLAETSEFRSWVENEFPDGASMLEGVQRRGFLKVMAASFGLAGLGMTSCRRPEHTILPYGKSPEELIPGVPNFYATAQPTPYGFAPLIAESHQGRPTKVEGNPSYIPSGGSTDIYSQASVLDLYDPDRAQGSYLKEIKKVGGEESTRWKKVPSSENLSAVQNWSNDGKLAIVCDSSFSLLRHSLLGELNQKGAFCVEFDAIDVLSNEKQLAASLGSTNPIRTLPNLRKAKRVLSLDCDFLSPREANSLVNSRGFMAGRKVLNGNDAKKMNRLYSVESDLTITGGVADHRLRLSSTEIKACASLLLSFILESRKKPDQQLIDHLKKVGEDVAIHSDWIENCAKDLLSKRKGSVVLAGNHLPVEIHVLTYAINQSLGSIGHCIHYKEVSSSKSYNSIEALVEAVDNKDIDSIVFLGGNPVLGSSSRVDWSELLGKVSNTARIGFSLDETSNLCDLHIGQSHYLESWDLGETWDFQSIVPTQPLIAPLFDTKSDIECLLSILGRTESSRDFALSSFESTISNSDFANFLRLGIHQNPESKSSDNISADSKTAILSISKGDITLDADNLEVVLVPDFHSWDGRYSNNGWLQECPDPISKLTWDNALLISPVLAQELEKKHPDLALLPEATMLNKNGQIAPDAAVFDGGRQKAPVVNLSLPNGNSIEGPIYVQPGLADYTVIASLGLGRNKVGRVGTNSGYDAYPLVGKNGERVLIQATCQPTGNYKILANVQEHWSMEGRAIVREANADEFISDEGFASHMGAESHSPPIWGKDQDKDLSFKARTTPRGNSSYEHPDHNYEKSDENGIHQWGMSIDLNQCTGCSSCVVACQSENNIPVVGKDQVLRGREMHWIRLDRYFSSPKREGAELPSDVQVSFQGVACMHCETAPCESVCPVNATVHDEEGLNAMAYNRCVGTRYCANNCPYKVRRFNFFDWNKRKTDELYQGPVGDKNDSLPAMGKNPDVTVRMRGVMEKCTYCVQRIQENKIKTKVNAQRNTLLETGKDGADLKLEKSDLKVKDGTIKTACQQVCPTDAIVFGDISDPESEVSKLKSNPRDYSVLGYLNTRPRTTFLAKVRNPNPKMPDFTHEPHATREYHDKAHPSHHGDEHDSKH